ncbi:metal ABC transporter substrate-binding protein [Paenibacillus sp. 598K]|uniref:metal ABC transporter substrate-binding protein n=1 Tax=Paenibacillus sp. 598K TaxID=1117987 RepID=UPI000FFA933E|nr:metal ABC transporter substrate-binding protein [Paenibacillus sp. 598K]GBF73312.1 metal ABC transporter substrate-binding protein [Paenibacillus sp. 598K]
MKQRTHTKKRGGLLWAGLLTALLLAGCANNGPAATGSEGGGTNQPEGEGKLKVVTTYSIVYDIVKQVGGDHVEVISLAPVGSNPHEFDPRPADVTNTADADAVFYNGMNLEAGNSWFEKLLETAGKDSDDAPVYLISEGVEVKYLTEAGNEGESDPHAWLDLRNGIRYAENAQAALSELDPDNSADYAANTERYVAELQQLHDKAVETFREIPENQRFLVTSEGAFKYFSDAYGIEAGYIWEINSESQGTPSQVQRIVDQIKSREVKGLFVETSVDPRSMESVSRDSGVPIVGEVYTDSLGKPGEAGDTYVGMMRHNIETIVEGLK